MRFLSRFFLLVLPGLSLASTDASVHIFQRDYPEDLSTPKLSPEQARLVFAQRLGVSHYHELGNVCETTLSYINQFGGKKAGLFENPRENNAELLFIVEGVSFETSQSLLDGWPSMKTNFQISRTSSVDSSINIFTELQVLTRQVETHLLTANVKPLDKSSWAENSRIIHLNLINRKDALDQLSSVLKQIQRSSELGEMNSAVILIPQTLNTTKSNTNDLETFKNFIVQKRQITEEPIISGTLPSPTMKTPELNLSSSKPIKGVLPACFKSLDLCISSTRNCSGHGQCSKKYEDRDNKGACFTCECRATNETVTWAQGSRQGWKISYWGGSACHKEDVSNAFWLISIFVIVMIGTASWAIQMLFSVGQESLPGVIGAGVSSRAKQS